MRGPSLRHNRAWLLPVVVAATVIVSSLGALTTWAVDRSADAVTGQVNARAQDSNAASRAFVRARVSLLEQLVTSYAEQPDVRAAVAAGLPQRGPSALTGALHQLQVSVPGLVAAWVSDDSGTVLGTDTGVSATIGTDLSYRDWYRGARPAGEPYLSAGYVNKDAAQTSGFAVSVAVRGPGGPGAPVVGVLGTSMSLASFSAVFAEAAPRGGSMVITDQAGQVLASPGLDQPLLSNRSAAPGVRHAIDGRTTLHRNDGWIQVHAPLGRGWTVGTNLRASLATAPNDQLASAFTAAGVGVALCLLAALLLLTRVLRTRARAERSLAAALEEVQQRRRFTDTVLDSLDAAVLVCDRAGALLYVNQRGREWYGMPELQPGHVVTDGSRREITHPDGRAVQADEWPLLRAMSTAGPVSGELLVRGQGATARRVLGQARPLLAADGSVIGAVVGGHDVTALRRQEAEHQQARDDALQAAEAVRAATAGLRAAEADARKQAALLHAVVSSIGDGVGVIDGDGNVLLHNAAARQLLGIGDDIADPDAWQEHYGMFLPDGTTPFPVQDMPLVRALAGESTDGVDMVIRRPGRLDPITISVTGRPLDASAGISGGGAVAVFHDVTLQRGLQARVAQQSAVQQRLLAALSDLGEGVTVVENGKFAYSNDAYARLTGYTPAELADLPISVLAADDDAAAAFACFAAALAEPGRTAAPFTTRVRNRGGHVVPVEVIGLSTLDHGAVQRISLVRDLTEPLAAAAELTRRADALEHANTELALARDAAAAASQAKSAFVARMSHEIRTPLNGVIGLTNLLCQTELTDSQRHLAQTAARSGDALLGIVNDILDFSKIEAGAETVEALPVDLAALLEDVAGAFSASAAGKGLDLLIDCPPLPELISDPTRLRQILTNLLGNAVKFTDHGHVTLSVQAAPAALSVHVTDSGPGIDRQAQQRLFHAFEQADDTTTRRYGGTGLGLAISRSLAELLGGSLSVTSRPGTGSTFTLTLPGVPAAAEQPPPLTGHHILVLSSRLPLRRHLTRTLRAWGATVDAPTDPYRAARPGQQVDAVVVDTRLTANLQSTPTLPAGAPVIALHPVGSPAAGPFAGDTALPLPLLPGRLLPCLLGAAAEIPQPRATTPSPQSARDRRLRVLIADDNEVNQLVARLMVEQLGHHCDIVSDGLEAVDAAQHGHYDVVLMDCQMPRLDGMQATRQLRAHPATAALPVLALTAGVTTDEREACRQAGMDGWLAKPLRLQDLHQHLDALATALPALT